jgi:hypothetical protein
MSSPSPSLGYRSTGGGGGSRVGGWGGGPRGGGGGPGGGDGGPGGGGGGGGPVWRRLAIAKIAATTAMAPRAISAQPHHGTDPLPELDVAAVVWVAWTVTDFELMIVAGADRLVAVLVTVLVGPVTECVLVAVVCDALLASDVVEVVVLLSFPAALEAESTTFAAALETAPLVDPAPHALSGNVRIASASAPESRRTRSAEAITGVGTWRGQNVGRQVSRKRFMLGVMLTRPRSARNGARRFAQPVLTPPRTPSIGCVVLSHLRRAGRRLEVDGDVLARIGLL